MGDIRGINDVYMMIRIKIVTTGARGFRLLKSISMSWYWSFHTQGPKWSDTVIYPWGWQGNASQKFLPVVIPHSGNPQGSVDTVLSYGIISIDKYPLFLSILGFLAGEGPT